MHHNVSALTIISAVLWVAAAVDIGFSIGAQVVGLGPLGILFAVIASTLNVKWMLDRQYDKECRAFDLGRGTVRPLKR